MSRELISSEAFAAAFSDKFLVTVRMLRKRGCPEDLAEDIAQAAWARGWEKREQFTGASSIASWIASIAWNLRLSEFRRKQVDQLGDVHNPAYSENFDSGLDAEKVISMCRPVIGHLLRERYLRDSVGNSPRERLLVYRARLEARSVLRKAA